MSDNNLLFNSEEIRDLPLRTEFVTGPAGPTGSQGAAGVGVTIGGITGQVLAKKSNANYDTEWVNQTAFPAVTWGSITGTLSNQTDLQGVLNQKAPASGISPSAISGTAVITTDPRLSDSRSPNGSATGDLSGSYPAPSVAKLQGYSVSATSPSIGQILQWGGQSWLPAAIPQGGSGGGGVNYFFNFNEVAVAPITGLPTSPQSAARLSRFATITQSAITSAHLSQVAYDLVAGFVSDPADPNVTQIPAGLWDFNIWADSNANSSNECILRIFVYKYNGTSTTLLSESDDIYVYDPTVINQYSASVVFPFTTILATDRIYIELRGKATQNNIHISLHFGNVTPSHAHTTFSSVAGTGVVKVVNGVFQTPANLIFDADVDAAAAIAQSKIANLTSDLAGKAPSTGISPSAISGTAVITTDARLSDARTPTAHASSHAVGGSDPLTASEIAALGLSTDSCIIVRSGDGVTTKYTAAKALTPNGSALSSTNRASLIILPSIYTLPAELTIDAEFVDIIGLGAQTQTPAVVITGNTFNVTANNVRISGVSVGTQAFNISSNKPLQVFENCVGGTASFGFAVEASGTFIDCVGGTQSFGSGGGGNASGQFINCVGGYGSFGGAGEVASGIFTDCTGGDYAFGGEGNATGTFTNCVAGFGGFAGVGGIASGKFTNCIAEAESFGGPDGIASGIFIDCTGGTDCFGGNGATASGKFTNCTGGFDSFGAEGTPSGTFVNCTLTVGTFNALSIPASGTAIMINCIDASGNIINGQNPL